ncbi:MAG: DUF4386 family protein [Actinobacteria bacterium]|nr:DUF4386 family protein [Actinomycetota bacterium]
MTATVRLAPPVPTTAEPPIAHPVHPPTSPRRAALIAGVGYVALFVLAVFANFFVFEAMLVPGDATATAANIADAPGLFRLGVVAFLAIFVIDVVVAWALHLLFRADDHDLSLASAWLRLAYTLMLGVGVVFLAQALQLAGGSGFLAALDADARAAQALVALDSFEVAWLVGLVAFGLHLGALGALLLRSRRGPRALAVLLVVAGVAYVLDTLAHLLLGNYEQYSSTFLAVVAVPSVVAEGWFGLWLLTRAGRGRVAA